MKLKGYIKALKENCFAIPIYSDGNSYYYHNINEDFKIIGFEKVEVIEDFFIKIYLSKTFDINSIAALIFVGLENYNLSNSADLIIDEVIFYLKDSTGDNDYLTIKEEAHRLRKILSRNKLSDNKKNNLDISLENYINSESSLMPLTQNIKERLIYNLIKNTILDDDLFNQNKEVFILLFNNFISHNKLFFEKIIFNTLLEKSFVTYLSEKSELYHPTDLSISDTLKLRANERRIKLKEFNYKFDLERLKIESVYKTGVTDIANITDNLKQNESKYIFFFSDKMFLENQKDGEVKEKDKQVEKKEEVKK